MNAKGLMHNYDRLHPTFTIYFSNMLNYCKKNMNYTQFIGAGIGGKILEDVFNFVPSWKK